MAVSRFQKQWRGATPVYTCRMCGKSTRETGDGESGVGLCWKCFEIAGLENTISDNEPGSPRVIAAQKRIDELRAL
ncbi:MAG: hypothetical protein HY855_25050 [Burkholderiales bacterium]|nr:hypothetical protein [Burkholderiales bacterium]